MNKIKRKSRGNPAASNKWMPFKDVVGIKDFGILQDPVFIINNGDTDLPINCIVERNIVIKENQRVMKLGGIPASDTLDYLHWRHFVKLLKYAAYALWKKTVNE